MLRGFGWLMLALTFALGAVLAYHNSAPTPLDYLAGRTQGPLAVWLLLAFALGVGTASLMALIRGLRIRSELRSLRRQLQRTETELKTLRSLPLKGA